MAPPLRFGFESSNRSRPDQIDAASSDDIALVRPTGFEPVAPRLGIWCSILLSYGRAGRFPSYGNRA